MEIKLNNNIILVFKTTAKHLESIAPPLNHDYTTSFLYNNIEVEYSFDRYIFKKNGIEIDWQFISDFLEQTIANLDELIKQSYSILFPLQSIIFQGQFDKKEGEFVLTTIQLTECFYTSDVLTYCKFQLTFDNEYTFDPYYCYRVEFIKSYGRTTMIGAKREEH